jgi:hypothetical protein
MSTNVFVATTKHVACAGTARSLLNLSGFCGRLRNSGSSVTGRDPYLRLLEPGDGHLNRISASDGAAEKVQGERREAADDAERDARNAEVVGDSDVPEEVEVVDDRVSSLLAEERLLRRSHQGLVDGCAVDAPPVGSGGGEVLDAGREAVHGREWVGGDLDQAARNVAVPLERSADHRGVRRGDGDNGLDGARPGRGEADGEVGEGADVAGGEEGHEQDPHLLASLLSS